MEIITSKNNIYIISVKKDSDFLKTLTTFAHEKQIHAAYLTAIGACHKLTLAWYNLETKKYEDHEYNEDLEIASLIGNISLVEGKPFIHAHGVFGKQDMSTIGGHIRSMIISAACEVRLEVFDGKIEREFDEVTGLNLMRCDK
ncbi:MAG TPA: DNA-binding protein [Candidatus Woesebacteria bacterium]|nr:DNA-binding protein [Candidatus Woesebacteria bacterium]